MRAARNNGEIEKELIPTRKSLLSRLRNLDDHESWRDFFETYWKLIYAAGIKAGLTDAEAHDVVQETVISVSRSMPGFHYDPAIGSFKAWLKQLTAWRIADQLRRRDPASPISQRRPDASTETDVLTQVPDPRSSVLDAVWETEWEKNLLDAAIERVKRKVDSHQYQMFNLTARSGWPASKVASTLGVSRGSVYLAKHRISTLVRKELERLKRQLI